MFSSRFRLSAFWSFFVFPSVALAAPSPTPTPQVIYNRPVGALAADPVRARVYATVPDDNTILVVDTASLTVMATIPIGSAPRRLAVSADRSKLWVANSGSTNFAIGVIDLDTLQRLPSFSTPVLPYDIEEGAGHRLYLSRLLSPFSGGEIMQVDGDTAAFLTSFGSSFNGGALLEISPDRGFLFEGNGGTLIKYSVLTGTPSVVQQANSLGSNPEGLKVSHGGQYIVYPQGGGNGSPPYTTYEIPTANIASVNGSFNIGAYPGPGDFSNDDTLLYHGGFSASRITIFSTTTFASLGTIPLAGNSDIQDVAIDRSGRWLFVSTANFSGGGDLRVIDTGRNDPGPTPLPTASPTPTVMPTPTPPVTPTPTPTAQIIYNHGVANVVADPVRSRVYGTVPNDNTVIVVDTASLSVISTIPIGSSPRGLSVSVDRSKLWVANSGSTNFAIGVIDLNTLQTLPSLSAPKQPYDIEEGAGHRLYVTTYSDAFPGGEIMQIDANTGAYLTAFGSYNGGALVEVSPDRGLLFVGDDSGMIKYNVGIASPAVIQQANNFGSTPNGLKISHGGQRIVFPHGGGNGAGYSTWEIPTANISSINGTFDTGAYPGPVAFSNDDTLLYHSAYGSNRIVVFSTTTFAPLFTMQVTGSGNMQDLTVDRSGRWLFVTTGDFQGGGDLRVFDTGRNDVLPAPSPTPTAPPFSPTPTATATPVHTPIPSPTPHTPTPTATPSPSPTATPSPSSTPPAQTVNLSTRMRVQTGDNVGIGGFIISGTGSKNVLLRALGPSLTQFGVPNALPDPILELHGPGGFATIVDNNWGDDLAQQALILATGLAPTNSLDSAIYATLNPGAYTAVVKGNNNATGVALIEVYDLSTAVPAKLANISTRAFVGTADDIVIAGFILGNQTGDDRIIARGIGPSLSVFGVPDVLGNPTLQLRNSDGALVMGNNDWQEDPAQAAELSAAGLAPSDPLESGIAATLPPGLYTALLAGFDNSTGNGVVEVYDRGSPSVAP